MASGVHLASAMLVQNLRILLGAACISVFAVGCAAPSLPLGASAPTITTSKVTSALASTTSQLKLSVTRWHWTYEKRSDGTTSGAVDGQDATGKVTFLSIIREDRATSTMRIQAVLPTKGEWVYSTKKKAVTTNTLSSRTTSLTTAFETDWKTAYPAIALTAPTSKAHGGAGAPKGSAPQGGGIDGDDPIADAGNYGLVALGHHFGVLSDEKYDLYMDEPGFDTKNYDANGKRIDQSAADKAQDADQDKEDDQAAADKAQDADQDKEDDQAAADKAQDADQDKEDDQAAADQAQDADQDKEDDQAAADKAQDAAQDKEDDLPSNNQGDLDGMGSSEPVSQNDQGGGDSDPSSDVGGSDEALAAGSFAPDAKAAPSNRCTKSATSATTGVRACVNFNGR